MPYIHSDDGYPESSHYQSDYHWVGESEPGSADLTGGGLTGDQHGTAHNCAAVRAKSLVASRSMQ